MGEHKIDRNALASAIGAAMTDRGKLLEEGFEALIKFFWKDGVTDEQRRDLRMTWFLACDHLYCGVMGAISPGDKITPRDIARMEGIADELEQFKRESLGKSSPAPGRRQ